MNGTSKCGQSLFTCLPIADRSGSAYLGVLAAVFKGERAGEKKHIDCTVVIYNILVQLLFLCMSFRLEIRMADNSTYFCFAYRAIRGEEHYEAVTQLSDK